MKKHLLLLKDTFQAWQKDKITVWSAALSYYTVFSLSPLLLLALSIAGIFFGKQALEGNLFHHLKDLLGPEAAATIQQMITKSHKQSTNVFTSVLSIVTLILGATGAIGQLKEAMNTIYKVQLKPGVGVQKILKDRTISFSIIAVITFLMLVSLVASAIITSLSGIFNTIFPFTGIILEVFNFIISLAFITIMFTIIFTILPDVRISWHKAFQGGMVTAILFTIGKTILGIYIVNSAVVSSYGAAASLAVILLWVYYASQILFFGAEYIKILYIHEKEWLPAPEPEAMRSFAEGKVIAKQDSKRGNKSGTALAYFIAGIVSTIMRERRRNGVASKTQG